jgi:hypothetical protein
MSDTNQTEDSSGKGEARLPNPSAMLEGLTLQNGWKVLNRIDLSAETTGGRFSIAYRVEIQMENGRS